MSEHLEAENKKLRDAINNIAHLIHYQSHLKEQDRWLERVIDAGLVKIDMEEL
tara:strand:- start:30234 stop:30392 length:159 start_codon:yes stop_codon:yes gene_type:complete